MQALRYYLDGAWPAGAMPGPGGMMDQPETFLAAMRHLSAFGQWLREQEKDGG